MKGAANQADLNKYLQNLKQHTFYHAEYSRVCEGGINIKGIIVFKQSAGTDWFFIILIV